VERSLIKRVERLEELQRATTYPEAVAAARATLDALSVHELGGWAYTYVATYQAEADLAEPVEPLTPGYRRWLEEGGLEAFTDMDKAYQALPEKRRAEIASGNGVRPRLDNAGDPILSALGIKGDRARAMAQGMLESERAAAEGHKTRKDNYE
jgi:hypothetical protein